MAKPCIDTPHGRTQRWTHNGDEAGVRAPVESWQMTPIERRADRALDQ